MGGLAFAKQRLYLGGGGTLFFVFVGNDEICEGCLGARFLCDSRLWVNHCVQVKCLWPGG